MPSANPKAVLPAVAIMAALVIGVFGAYALSQARERRAIAVALTGGDPAPAPALMIRYGCSGCHSIEGVPGADGRVAPPLIGLLDRVYIGGTAYNTPDNLIAWIAHPQQFAPHSAMPETGISDNEARDVAAFLYAH
jgi:cytochrome c2